MTSWTIDTPRELTFDENEVAALEISIAGGHVDVVATAGRPRLEISALEGTPLVVELESGRLSVRYDEDVPAMLSRWVRPFERRSVTISVAVPPTCSVDLRSASAAAVVSGIEADAALRSASGPITLDSLDGRITVRSASGHVEARGLRGALDMSTVAGDITVADGSSERLTAKTVSGRLTVDLDIDARSRLTVASVSGDVAVRLPETADLTVDLRSVNGELGAAFEGLHRKRQPGRVAAHGRLGRGSGRLSASTVSGDIALLRRPDTARSAEPA